METIEKQKIGQTSTTLPEIMDVKQLSQYLGIGKSKIYNLIRNKKIPASRIGRQYKFSKEVIEHWLKEKQITAPTETQVSLFTAKEKE